MSGEPNHTSVDNLKSAVLKKECVITLVRRKSSSSDDSDRSQGDSLQDNSENTDSEESAAAQSTFVRRLFLHRLSLAAGGLAIGGFVGWKLVSPWSANGCDPHGSPPRIDTADHFDTTWYGQVVQADEVSSVEYDLAGSSLPGTSEELLIHVHGWRNDRTCGIKRIETVTDTLKEVGYDAPVTGLTWDSAYAWWNATEIARRTAPKLAHFLVDFASENPSTAIRLQAHSLGALIVAEALQKLAADDRTDLVTTVILLGGAIPAESVSLNGRYGPVINRVVGHVENFWMEEDTTLNRIYRYLESGDPLGTTGCQGPLPSNYTDHEISSEFDHASYYSDQAIAEDVIATFTQSRN